MTSLHRLKAAIEDLEGLRWNRLDSKRIRQLVVVWVLKLQIDSHEDWTGFLGRSFILSIVIQSPFESEVSWHAQLVLPDHHLKTSRGA
jgi:hypothetical protein